MSTISFLVRDQTTRRQIGITLLILVVYRLGAFIPVPGVDQEALSAAITQSSLSGYALALINLFSGGTLSKFSILGLGIFPYITALEITVLLSELLPGMKERVEDQPWQAQAYLKSVALWLTIPVSLLSAAGMIWYLSAGCDTSTSLQTSAGFLTDNWLLAATTLVSMTAGTMFAVWLSSLIDADGFGTQGVNLLVFSGIPGILAADLLSLTQAGIPAAISILVYLGLLLLGVFTIVLLSLGKRNVPVQYGRRMVSRSRLSAGTSHIPLPMMADFASAGYAQSLLLLPGLLAVLLVCSEIAWLQRAAQFVTAFFSEEGFVFWLMLFLLTIAFTYFVSETNFAKQDVANALQKQGGFIPGIRPGRDTRQYLLNITRRLILIPALVFGIFVISPRLIEIGLGFEPSLITGTALIFLVSVVRDIVLTLQARTLMKSYEGFLK